MDRGEIQEYIEEHYIQGQRKGIYELSVRLGKTRIGVHIMEKLNCQDVLIAYPNQNILNAWVEEFDKVGWKPSDVTFSTFLSLDKYIRKYELVVIDECHLLSERQREAVYQLCQENDNVLCLTGTLDDSTKDELWFDCGLRVLERYTTEEAIKNSIVSDYRVEVVLYTPDSKNEYWKRTKTKKWKTTERKELNSLSKRVMSATGENKKWAALSRMRFINGCSSLKTNTRKLLQELSGKRLILFGADTNFIDSLDIPTYHSKSDEDRLSLFLESKIDKLGLCKLGSSGTTFPSLDTIVICDINSNSENLFQKIGRSLLLEEGKVSTIYIVCSDEEFQMKWLLKALKPIPEERIKYRKI